MKHTVWALALLLFSPLAVHAAITVSNGSIQPAIAIPGQSVKLSATATSSVRVRNARITVRLTDSANTVVGMQSFSQSLRAGSPVRISANFTLPANAVLGQDLASLTISDRFNRIIFSSNNIASMTVEAPLPAPALPPASAPGSGPTAARQCTQKAAQFEFYNLPPPGTLTNGTSFISDWANRPAGGGFLGLQAVDSCRMHFDGFLTQYGKPTVRVEVNPGDDPLGLGTDRAEVLIMQDSAGHQFSAEGRTAATIYYASSYYFPVSWDGTFIQGNGNSWSFVNQFYGWTGLSAGRHSATGKQIYTFANRNFSDGGLVTPGAWTDFVFEINYATGAFNVYRREQGQAKFILVMNATDANAKNTEYYKQGLYRGPDVGGRTDVLWIGPTSRGISFSAVEMASFGTNNGF